MYIVTLCEIITEAAFFPKSHNCLTLQGDIKWMPIATTAEVTSSFNSRLVPGKIMVSKVESVRLSRVVQKIRFI